MESKRLAIIRLCGDVGVKKEIKDTFQFLRLYNKFTCIVVPSSQVYVGMIHKINDYVTWGEINKETLKLLLAKRGKITKKEKFSENYLKEKTKLSLDDFSEQFVNLKKEFKDVPGLKNFFKLCPPRGGFEKNGTKKPYSLGGSLGYRKDKINELIQKML
jgi:large subunit ribosomal protein L30